MIGKQIIIFVVILFIVSCAGKHSSPLIEASINADTQTVKKLIREGANINQGDKDGLTPLMYAGIYGNSEMIKVLLDLGADINIKDKQGYNALFHSTIYGNLEVTKYLIENKADLNAMNSFGDSPLTIATTYCNKDMAIMLVERGADVNARKTNGMQALHISVQCYGPEGLSITKTLLDKGADLTSKDNSSKTPLNYALEYKQIDTVALIRTKYQENWNTGPTPLYDALRAPSRMSPEKDEYIIPQGKETAFNNAVIDCNDLVIPYKTVLLFAGGPIGYGAGLVFDRIVVKDRFQKCMAKMGFQCVKDCSNNESPNTH